MGGTDLVQGICETGHELGLDKLSLPVLELALLLDSEGGGLQAKLLQLVASSLDVLQVGAALLQDWAGIRNTAALHLQVGQPLQFIVCQSMSGLPQQHLLSDPLCRHNRLYVSAPCCPHVVPFYKSSGK
jgi:hypothetical protein